MEVFNLTLNQMLTLFTLMVAGFLLRKKNILPGSAETAMSRLETYIFVPALNLYNAMTNCTPQTFRENSVLILYGAGLTLSALLLCYPISALFVRNSKGNAKREYLRNIYKYALTFGNFGFLGNAVILGIWGSEMLFKYTMFNLCATLVCNSWGLYVLIPKDQSNSLRKSIVNGITKPPVIALFVGIILGLLNAKPVVPQFALTALSNASGCMGPVAMLLAGFVIGGYEFKGLFSNVKVYIITALRLIVIPAVMVLALMLTGASEEIITLALIAFATPIGLNSIVFPAAYGGDTKLGASMTMISSSLAVITIPLMYLLFVVLM